MKLWLDLTWPDLAWLDVAWLAFDLTWRSGAVVQWCCTFFDISADLYICICIAYISNFCSHWWTFSHPRRSSHMHSFSKFLSHATPMRPQREANVTPKEPQPFSFVPRGEKNKCYFFVVVRLRRFSAQAHISPLCLCCLMIGVDLGCRKGLFLRFCWHATFKIMVPTEGGKHSTNMSKNC